MWGEGEIPGQRGKLATAEGLRIRAGHAAHCARVYRDNNWEAKIRRRWRRLVGSPRTRWQASTPHTRGRRIRNPERQRCY